MTQNTRSAIRAVAGVLALALVLTVTAQEKKSAEKDPPRTAPYMNQLRLLFASWDKNKDEYLDKEELAIAFRGPGSKPFDIKETRKKEKEESTKDSPGKDSPGKDSPVKDAPVKESSSKDSPSTKDTPPKDKTTKKPDYSKYPDYVFLMQLDQDTDEKISRDEFMTWARDYAVQLRDRDELNKKILDLQTKIKKAPPKAKNKASLEAQLRKQQDQIRKLQQKMAKYKGINVK